MNTNEFIRVRLSIGCLLFGIASAVCLYKTSRGLSFFAYCIFALVFFLCYLSWIKQRLKLENIFLSAILLTLAFFCGATLDGGLRFFNFAAIFLIADRILLHQFNDDGYWSVSQHLGQLLKTAFVILENIPAWFAECVTRPAKQTEDAKVPKPRNNTLPYVILGLCLALPLLIIVLAALASADEVFARVIERLISLRLLSAFFRNLVPILLFTFGGALLSCAALTCFTRKKAQPLPQHVARRNPVVAITILSVLGAVYVLFCAIQIIYLFGKASLPDGYTYASYAKRGFFQLLFVCVLNVILILLANEVFRKNRALRILSAGFSACTLIMNLSATYRVVLYIQAYDLTYARLVALTGLGVVYLLLAGLLVWTFRNGFPFFRYMLLVLSLTLVFLNVLRPIDFITRYNLSHSDEPDIRYLASLGAQTICEAANAYEDGTISEAVWEEYLEALSYRYSVSELVLEREEEANDFRSYNIAWEKIKDTLEDYDENGRFLTTP